MSRDISPPAKRRRVSVTESPPARQIFAPPTSPQAPHQANQGTMRIFSWNINGTAPFLQKSITNFFQVSQLPSAKCGQDIIPPASLRGFLQRHSWPAILFLQEVKVAVADTKTQNAVRMAVNARLPSESTQEKQGPRYEAHFTLPNDAHNARGLRGNGKVYGVCSIIRSDILSACKGSVRTVEWDREGRVSIVELRFPTTKIALFNIYAVNGTDNPYRDPWTGVIRGTRHDRKLVFHRLLKEECVQLEEEGWDVLLAGDMNVAPSTLDGFPRLRTFPQQHVLNRADFKAKFLGEKNAKEDKVFDGVDVWREMHGHERRYTYFPRGRTWGSSCDRVDYVVIGRKTWGEGVVKGSGILDSEAERGPSDHVPIWVDISMETERLTSCS